MLLIKIAFRNIFRQKRRTIFTVITMVVGFILFALSISMSEGTYGTAISAFIRSGIGKVQINKKGYRDSKSIYDNFKPFKKQLDQMSETLHIEWSPHVYSSALAFTKDKITALNLIGIDPQKEAKSFTIKEKIDSGMYLNQEANMSIMISSSLAKVLGVKPGDTIALVAQGVDGSIANDIFRVVAILKAGANSLNKLSSYVHINDAQTFLSMGGRVHNILLTGDISEVKLLQNLKKEAGYLLTSGKLEANTWMFVRKEFYDSMQADKKGMWVSFLIIAIMVALGVLNTVLMSVLERTREYGLLRALGSRPLFIFFLIVVEAVILALISVVVGLFFFVFINYFMVHYGIPYPTPIDVADVTLTEMKGSYSFIVYWYPSIITVLTALAVSIMPAIRAAKVAAIKAIRAI